MARGQWQRAGAAADRSRRAVPGAPDPGQGEAPRPHGGSGSGASCHRAYVAQARFARRPCSGLIGPRLGWRAVPDEGAPTCGNVATGRQERPATPVSGSPVGGSNRGRGCVHRRVPARGRRGPVVGGHANQSQVKGGCRHGQAWVMDPGRCGPDPGERVSVEGGALEPGSGRCTVDPGVAPGHRRTRRICPPRSGPPLGPLTAARAQSPHRARRYMHRRGPVLGHCRPGPPRVTPASAHCPPRGSPHVSQRDTGDVDAGVEVGEGGVGVQIRPRAAGDARPAGSSATPYPGAVSPIPTAGARSMVSASRP